MARLLRTEMARLFDPACGSGHFLVIAYRHMREIKHEVVKLTGDAPESVMIRLTDFYGIEIKGFAAEFGRLALLIAEFQADARLISQQAAAQTGVRRLRQRGYVPDGRATTTPKPNWR